MTNALPSKESNLFGKNFILIVIGQIISLFGNETLRFALPFYIYKITGSELTLGLVSAVAFLPMIVMSPIGGMVALRHTGRIRPHRSGQPAAYVWGETPAPGKRRRQSGAIFGRPSRPFHRRHTLRRVRLKIHYLYQHCLFCVFRRAGIVHPYSPHKNSG